MPEMKSTSPKLLLAIDGNSLIYQAYYAFFKANLTTRDGFPTGALKGFFTKLLELLKMNPTHVLVAFDVHEPTFRHKEYADYKAGRKPPTEDLLIQLSEIHLLLKSMGITVIECSGFEADDILGTFAKKAEQHGMDTLIVTGDRDSFQLISQNTRIYYTKDNSIIDEKELFKRYSLRPEQMKDLKALMGDASDNIPGIAGIGEKTALKLLEQYGDLEGVLQHSNEIKGKLGDRIRDGAEDARFSYWLGTISSDAPVKETIDDCSFDVSALAGGRARLLELEMQSIAARIPDASDDNDAPKPFSSEIIAIRDLESLRNTLAVNSDRKEISILCDPLVSFSFDEKKSFVISPGETLLDITPDESDVYELLLDYILKNRVSIVTYDGKTLLHKFSGKRSAVPQICFDVQIADYLLQSNRPAESFAAVCVSWLHTEQPSAACLFALRRLMEPEIKAAEMDHLLNDVELPLQKVLYEMERTGVCVDGDVLRELHNRFHSDADEISARIYERAGEEFNILSPKQLGAVLFEKLGLPSQKKTKTGYSTDAEALERISGLDPIVPDILQYRFLSKLDSTFAEGLLKQMSSDGRIHTTFMQCVTATGRISSIEPNLQNIPVRTDEGREIRKAFVPSKGNVLVGADYSQIELRLLAHFSSDNAFIQAFRDNEDIHARTAAEVFRVPLSSVTSELRSAAKAVNFGIVYGISDFGLAKNIGVSVKTASAYIKKYFERYPNVEAYLKDSVEKAKENGFAVTLLGRRRPLPELKSSNYNIRQFGERVAMNMPIQGSAADIIKLAMVAVSRELKERGLKSKLVLQIHDELIVDAPADEAQSVCEIMRRCMENVYSLQVPLIAEAKIGKSWYETK